ncbi:MAG: metalloregulator ArsR/SmtB family transcription factor [Sphaerochaetaceae bacterium]|nr:metalloregulator ArsR/SmtB family transcription factor [Sphaerochaetaceae bacterium]
MKRYPIPELFETLKPLSDQRRYTIIKMLLVRDYCVGGLARKLMISEAAVSQHLKILKEAGIVTGTKRGYFMHYRVNRDFLQEMAQGLLDLSNIPQINSSLCHSLAKEGCLLCKVDP